MKPSKRFGAFGCVPRKLPRAWHEVRFGARSMGIVLMSRCEDLDTMQIPVAMPDWQTDICKQLEIGGSNDRRTAKINLTELKDAGLLSVGLGFVRLNLVPDVAGVRSTCAPDVGHVRSTCAPRASKVSQVLGMTRLTSDRSEKEIEKKIRSEQTETAVEDPYVPQPRFQKLVAMGAAKLAADEAAGELAFAAAVQEAAQ